MDSRTFQFNKMAGAVLGTALAVMVVSIVADVIYAPAHTGKPGFVIATAAPSGEGQAAAAGGASTVPPIAVRLQSADVAAGKSKTGVCRACHTFDKGQPAKVGPNLYGVVGSPAIHPGFKYSEAMQKKGAAGLTWTFQNLDEFLTSPKAFVPGTLMTFAGLKNPKDRANVIAYLNSNSDKPLALPSPGGTTPAGGTPAGDQSAPAAGGTPAGDQSGSAPAAGGTPAGGTTPAGDQQTPAGGTTPQHSTELPAPAGAQ